MTRLNVTTVYEVIKRILSSRLTYDIVRVHRVSRRMRCGKYVISVDAIVSLISPSANPAMIIDSDSERLKAFLRYGSGFASGRG